MATESSATGQYEEKVDGLLAMLNSSLSSGEEPSDLDSVNSVSALTESKSVREVNRSQRLLEDEMKLLMEHYKVIVKENNVIIEEKNRMMERMRNNNELKSKLEETIEQNKRLMEQQLDQMRKEHAEDNKRFEKELSEVKAKLDEQADLLNKKDGEIERLKMEAGETLQQKLSFFEQQTSQSYQLYLNKNWRDLVSRGFRNSMAYKIIQEIIPMTDLSDCEDKEVINQVAYVKKFENDTFENAKSQGEYCSLMAEKKKEIQKKLNEKRLNQSSAQPNHLNSKAENQQQMEQKYVNSPLDDTTPSTDSKSEQELVVDENTLTNYETSNNDKKQDNEVVCIDDNNSSSIWKVGAKVKVVINDGDRSEEATIVDVNDVGSQIMVRFDSDEKKNRMKEVIEDTNELKIEPKEAIDQKKIIEERFRLVRERAYNRNLCQPLDVLINKVQTNEQTKLAIEKDEQIKTQQLDLVKEQQLKQPPVTVANQLSQVFSSLHLQSTPATQQQSVSALPPTNDYPKKVLLVRNGDLGFLISELPNGGGGVYFSWIAPDSPAARAGIRAGQRLLEVNGIDLRKADIFLAAEALKQGRLTIQIVVDAPPKSQHF